MVFSTKLDSLSHVSDGLFSVRNALFCLGAVTWTSMDFLSFSHGMDRLFRETERTLPVLGWSAFQDTVLSSPWDSKDPCPLQRLEHRHNISTSIRTFLD